MSTIAITLNHMRAVKQWADAAGADTQLDLRSFELEVKCRNRFYRFKPRFLGQDGGRHFHTEKLVDKVTGFIGWLPYGVLRTELSDDKLVFKHFAAQAGLRVPASWTPQTPQGQYLLKRSAGSFGYEITGPWRKGATQVRIPPETRSETGTKGSLFAEQFIEGDSLKVWFWGDQPFYAHRQSWPAITGDGVSTIESLAAQRLGVAAADLAASVDYPFVESSLAFQDLSPTQVLSEGRRAWIDFRYGRSWQANVPRAGSDNQLAELPPRARERVTLMGAAVAAELKKKLRAPVLYAVDGVLDADGEVWWLEINSNPILPPEGYATMFGSLFGPNQP